MRSINDEQAVKDSQQLIGLTTRVSSHGSKLFNAGTISFDSYRYKYSTGREGNTLIIGFYPRKGKLTIYLTDGTARSKKLLARLGNHTATGYCIYVKNPVT